MECGDVIGEIVVVDNASPDDSARIAATYPGVRVIWGDENRGFAWACNRGYEETTLDSVLFLNSDTVAFPGALQTLLNSLYSGEDVAMVGPLSNYAGYEQSVSPTFSGLSNLRCFVEGMAQSEAPDREVDMLVGFCLGVKRWFLDQWGGFDPRFNIGLWEDNDISYRARREGFRLLVCQRSYVHHFGSSSFPSVNVNFDHLFWANRELFVQKWECDLRSGFASGLSGIADGPIVFNRELALEN
jgi:GT2 family glycosyltransferase